MKARIKALTDKTVANGCTEAEAMSAAEMVGRLLERYALSMDEIEVRSAMCAGRGPPRQSPPAPDRWLRTGHRPVLRLQSLARAGGAARS